MKLTFYGRLRDAVGLHEMDCFPPTTVDDSESLRAWVGADYPALLDPKVRMAFDNILVGHSSPVAGVTEVAFLPPVSGG